MHSGAREKAAKQVLKRWSDNFEKTVKGTRKEISNASIWAVSHATYASVKLTPHFLSDKYRRLRECLQADTE